MLLTLLYVHAINTSNIYLIYNCVGLFINVITLLTFSIHICILNKINYISINSLI